MTNELFIKNLINKYPNLNNLIYDQDMLCYLNQKVDLNNINLETFFQKNPKLMNDLNYLTSEEVFKIISYHCNYLFTKKNKLDIDENITIKGLRALKHQDNYGMIKNYLYIIDYNDNSYIEPCDYAQEVFEYYQKNNFQITIFMINEFLKKYNDLNILTKFEENLKNNIIDNEYLNMMLDLLTIKDYLSIPLQNELNSFLSFIENLKIKENLNSSEEKVLNIVKQKNEIKQEISRVRKKDYGYFNGFMLITLVTLLGIILRVNETYKFLIFLQTLKFCRNLPKSKGKHKIKNNYKFFIKILI